MYHALTTHAHRHLDAQVTTLQQRLIALHLEQHALTEQLISACGPEQAARVLIAAYDTARLATIPSHEHESR